MDSSGIRRKRRVQAHTRTQALEALSALKAKVQTERVLGVKFSSEMSTVDFLAKYKRHQRTRLKLSTFERLDSVIAALVAKLPALLKDISKAGVAEYIATRSAEVSPATVRKEIATLKHALGLAVDDWELIHTNPAQRVKLPKLSEGRTRYLSPSELRAVLEAAPQWMRAPIALAAFTGMRRGEILNLCWKDVDLSGRRLYLHETKNGTLRIVPLNELAYEVLASLPKGDPGSHVLPGVDGPRLGVTRAGCLLILAFKTPAFTLCAILPQVG